MRERKCHTARRLASTPTVVLSWEGGVAHPGVPHPTRDGVPPRMGYSPARTGVPPGKGPGTSHRGTPQKGHGTSESIMGWRWGTL